MVGPRAGLTTFLFSSKKHKSKKIVLFLQLQYTLLSNQSLEDSSSTVYTIVTQYSPVYIQSR